LITEKKQNKNKKKTRIPSRSAAASCHGQRPEWKDGHVALPEEKQSQEVCISIRVCGDGWGSNSSVRDA
jgi:hypothetical protein